MAEWGNNSPRVTPQGTPQGTPQHTPQHRPVGGGPAMSGPAMGGGMGAKPSGPKDPFADFGK